MDEKEKIYSLLKEIIDPELAVNIVDLGLVYNVELPKDQSIHVDMTLTSKGCPMGEAITSGVGAILSENYPEHSIRVNLVWEPQWTPEMISEEGLSLL